MSRIKSAVLILLAITGLIIFMFFFSKTDSEAILSTERISLPNSVITIRIPKGYAAKYWGDDNHRLLIEVPFDRDEPAFWLLPVEMESNIQIEQEEFIQDTLFKNKSPLEFRNIGGIHVYVSQSEDNSGNEFITGTNAVLVLNNNGFSITANSTPEDVLKAYTLLDAMIDSLEIEK